MKKFTLLLACCYALSLKGQQNNFNQSPVTFQSPDATQFIRYGTIPMSYTTGVPNITIPIYTVSCGGLNLPIDLSYNASGIKVLDVAGTAGLGWSLNAGGLIASTVLGTRDELQDPKAFLSAEDANAQRLQCNDYQCRQNYVEKFSQAFSLQKETQSDRYFYSFNGRSGIFRVDFVSGVAKTIPYSPLKISLGQYGVSPYKITSEDGTNYYFGQPELSGNPPNNSISYYLTKIESADLTHTINLYYKADGVVSQIIKNYSLEHSLIPAEPGQNPTIEDNLINNEFVNNSFPVMPDSITSDNETIQFQYIADRPDLRQSRLSRITILNRVTRAVIKIIDFQTSYFGTAAANNQRLRLDGLFFKDAQATTIQTYGFNYNSTPLPPYYHSVGWSEHHNVDYWGYYNGADDPNLLPRDFLNNTAFGFTQQQLSFYGGNRNPNPATAQACILTEINYPTGGKTNFEYELNQVSNGYDYPNSPADFGGLRVKKIISTADASSLPIVKSYKYFGGFNTMIEQELFLYNINRKKYYMTPGDASTKSIKLINGTGICTDPFLPLTTGIGGLVVYSDVFEYDGTETNNNGYVEYLYETFRLPYSFFDPGSGGNPSRDGFYLTDYGNLNPLLHGKIYYAKGPNNTYKQIRSEGYAYNDFNTGSFITGVKLPAEPSLIKTGYYSGLTDCDAVCYLEPNCGTLVTELTWNYNATNTVAKQDVPLLVSKSVQVAPLDGSGNLLTTTNYTYDLVTLQPIQEQTINSKGETIISVNKYPTDFSSSAPYNTMVSRNILTPVIEQLSYKNSISSPNFLQSSKTNYDFWDGGNWSSSATNIIPPRTVDFKAKNQAAYETRLRYYSYDNKGSPISFSKENDSKVSYIWDYQSAYPVAEVTNASNSDMAYTSFESDGKGNWTYSGSISIDNTASTGMKCYNLSGGSISKSGLISSGNYIVSYWSKNGQQSVTQSGTVTSGRILGSWTYYEHLISNPSGGIITVSGSGTIDELRLYPKGALMKTYTYTPLIGINSQCDGNNRITYYEYDNAGRLILVRDQDKKIIKKICYNYAGQVENCNIPCTYTGADWQNTATALRCQQGSCGNTGYQEQEQKDMNACSPTYNQTQWVVAGYNATACPPQTCVNLTSTNVTAATGYTASYYNTATGVTYNFAVQANIHLYALGTLPPGNYTLTISRTTGFPIYGTFKSGCFKQTITGTSAVFYNVGVSATTCNSITVDLSPN